MEMIRTVRIDLGVDMTDLDVWGNDMVQRKKSVRRKVQSIVDGDTFKVRNRVAGSQYIRVSNLNAPEKGERGYATAKKSLSKLKGKNCHTKT